MKKILIMPIVTAVLFTACGEDGPVTPDTRASVRFFNATTGMTGSGGFTTNGQFASGSAVAPGQSSQNCARVDAGATTFGFGAANSGGTALSGSALATLNSQSIVDGGNFIVVASGPAASPTLFMLDNSLSGTLGPNQAVVRFVNLAPGTATVANSFATFNGAFGAEGTTLHVNNPVVGTPTTFVTVASGANTFSLLRNHELPATVTTFDLQAGSINTIAIVQNTSGGFQLVNIPRCS